MVKRGATNLEIKNMVLTQRRLMRRSVLVEAGGDETEQSLIGGIDFAVGGETC